MRLGVWLCVFAVGGLELVAGFYDGTSWLSPASGSSVFRWIGAVSTAIAALCAVALARRGRSASRLLLAAGLGYVAIDQVLGLHERFGADLDARALTSLHWNGGLFVLQILLLGGVCLLLVREARLAQVGSALIAAGTALLATAIGARFGGGALAALDQLPDGEPRQAGEAAMHACGLCGWLLVAAGLAALTHERLLRRKT